MCFLEELESKYVFFMILLFDGLMMVENDCIIFVNFFVVCLFGFDDV